MVGGWGGKGESSRAAWGFFGMSEGCDLGTREVGMSGWSSDGRQGQG